MSDTKYLIGFILGIFFILILIVSGLVSFTNFVNSTSCNNQFGSFEHTYDFWGGCKLHLDNKWIPASSYYYKEGK